MQGRAGSCADLIENDNRLILGQSPPRAVIPSPIQLRVLGEKTTGIAVLS